MPCAPSVAPAVGEISEALRLAGIGIWRWDLISDQMYWSPTLCAMFGLATEVPSPPYSEQRHLFLPDSYARLDQAVRACIDHGEPYHGLELEFAHASGERRWLVACGEPVRNQDGQIIALRGTAEDITERKRIEDRLEQSERRFRLAMRHAPIGKAIVALDGRFVEVNESLCVMLQYSEAELLQRNFQQITHPDDIEPDMALLQSLLRGERDQFRMIKRYLRADGAELLAQLDVTLLRNRDGSPAYFISQVQDISERRRMEEEQRATSQRLALALQVSGIGVWDYDVRSKAVTIDAAIAKIYGLPEDAKTAPSSWSEIIHTDDVGRAADALREAIRSKSQQTMEYRVLKSRLGWRYIESAFGVELDEQGEVTRVVGVIYDVTDKWQAEQRVSRSHALLRDLIDNLPVWVSMVDAKGRYVVTNRRNAATLGLDVAAIEGRPFAEVLRGTPLQRMAHCWERALAGEMVSVSEIFAENGRRLSVDGVCMPVSSGPHSGHALCVLSDVTAAHEAQMRLATTNRELERHVVEITALQERLREQALRDKLTGLFNRRHFDEMLPRTLDDAAKAGVGVSLLLTDLDHFKLLNDTYGHQAGDHVLECWGDLLRRTLRGHDLLFRYGGEEFAIVLPNSPLTSAQHLAQRLCQTLRSTPIRLPDGQQLRLTTSVGVAFAPPGTVTAEDLIGHADTALYEAKSSGRDRVVVALPLNGI